MQVELQRRRLNRDSRTQSSPAQRWAELQAEAEAKAGGTREAHKRAAAYWDLFEASQGNFMFPLVATHGSLWGVTHTQRIERVLRRVLPLSRHGRLQRWIDSMDAMRDVNRRVFIEIYTTFWFTREHGHSPTAAQFVNPGVLRRYNQVHAAVRTGQPLTREERRAVYYEVFVHEQHDVVHPGIQEAIAIARTPALVRVLKHVRPRFAYFPAGESLRFTDFTSLVQRNREGLRALAFAEDVGPARVKAAMAEYPADPPG